MPASNLHPAAPVVLDPSMVGHVAGTCLCLHAQRAARALARRFDAAFKPLGLTSGQFSVLMALNRPQPPGIGTLAEFLAMDRTTLTAALKPLQRRALVEVLPDPDDRRGRRVAIMPAGVALLGTALPVWRATHAQIDATLAPAVPASNTVAPDALAPDAQALREALTRLARLPARSQHP